jgi:hypothetical protein
VRTGFEPAYDGFAKRGEQGTITDEAENKLSGGTRSPEIAQAEVCAAQSMPIAAPPMTAAEALTLAIKLAVDEGDLDRAGALLDVAKKARPTPAMSPTVVPFRPRRA